MGSGLPGASRYFVIGMDGGGVAQSSSHILSPDLMSPVG